jgi:Tol biopolymer transport system component
MGPRPTIGTRPATWPPEVEMRCEKCFLLICVLPFILFGCAVSPGGPSTSPTTPTALFSTTNSRLPSQVPTPPVRETDTPSPLPSQVPTPLVRGTATPSPGPTLKDRPVENTVYYLVWQEEEESDRSEIWQASLDGTEQRLIYQRIRPRETDEDSEEQWSIQYLELSPDGQKLAFSDLLVYWSKSARSVWFYKQVSIWVIDVDGSRPVKLIEFTEDDQESDVHVVRRLIWSPDSTRLLVHRLHGYGRPDILHVVNVATGEVTEIGPGTAGSWSPDSRFITYARNRTGANGTEGFYVTTADGQEQKRILPWDEFTYYQLGPEWSPDGERLLFSTKWLTGTALGNVCTIAPDGTQLQPLLSKVEYFDPQWSPDGRYIAMGGGTTSDDLHILDIQSGRTWRVASDIELDSVEWSDDSLFLLVYKYGISGGIYYIRAEDGKQVRIPIPVEAYHPTW